MPDLGMVTEPAWEALGFRIKVLALAAADLSLWETTGGILGWGWAKGGGRGSLPLGRQGAGWLAAGAERALGLDKELLASVVGCGVLQRSSCLHLSLV